MGLFLTTQISGSEGSFEEEKEPNQVGHD